MNNNFDILAIRDYYPSKNNPSSSTWVYSQVRSLSEMGFNPLVISPTPINPLKSVFKKRFRRYDFSSKELESYEGTSVLRPPYFKVPNNKLVSFTLRNLSKCISKYGDIKTIKLIHAHFGQNGVAAIELKRKLNVPLITSFYGYDSGRLAETYKPFYQELIKEGDLFLALSNDMKNDLLNLGFSEEKVAIHHLGVDLSLFSPNQKKNKSEFVLLTVARLSETKGIQYVIKALSQLLKEEPHLKQIIRYRIIGGGSYEAELKGLVRNFHLDNNVSFVNNLICSNSREIVINEMKKCDVFLLCSCVSKSGGKEGTPVVLMEAQACGKPCIATYHAGIPEVVKNKMTGYLVKERNINDIKEYIKLFYDNPSLVKKMGENARKHVVKNFNQNLQIKRLYSIYMDLWKKNDANNQLD
jgi:colanic acid/amylovoran biosynthesis glycosyltransferase